MCAAQMAERQIHPYYILSVLAHPVRIGAGFHPRVLQLLLFGQLGKGNLSLHELAHEGGGVRFHQGVEQRLLAGEIAVEGPGSHPGVLHDLPQGGALKPFVQELRQRSFLDFSRVAVVLSSIKQPPYNSAIKRRYTATVGSICQGENQKKPGAHAPDFVVKTVDRVLRWAGRSCCGGSRRVWRGCGAWRRWQVAGRPPRQGR